MHIAYVTPEFVTESQGGGLATYLMNISRIMRWHGHDVTIITLSEHHNDRMTWEDGITVERVIRSDARQLVPVRTVHDSMRLRMRLQRVHKTHPVDIVQYASFMAVGICSVRSIPSVVRISSDPVCWREMRVYDFHPADLNNACLSDKIEYGSIKRISNVFGPSKATGAYIEKRTGQAVRIIESPYFPVKTQQDSSLYDSLLKDKKYFLAHSTMSCLKGTHVIAEAIPEIAKQDPDVYFVFAGTDHGIQYRNGDSVDAKKYIEQQCGAFRSKVIILGSVEREKLRPVIQHAFACLMPSRLDNMPNTCIEAMSMGKVVIGTNGASYEQMITDGKNGLLIDSDSPSQLAAAAMRVLTMSQSDLAAMENEAAQTTKRFDPETIYQSLTEYYSEIIRKYHQET